MLGPFRVGGRLVPWRRLVLAIAGSVSVCLGFARAAEPADTVIAIARFTVWPDQTNYGLSFRMCLREDDPAIGRFLDRRGILVQGRPLSLHTVNPARFATEPCHAAYFSAGLAEPSIIKAISTRPVLTVSAQPGFAKAGGVVEIAPVEADDRLLVSYQTLDRHPLKLRAPLLEIAGKVEE